jgi:uncharacterized protein (DUF433 family)
MAGLVTNEYVELRGEGLYLAGTRISLDSVAYALRRGEDIEAILADFPAIESRARLEGAIAFIEKNRVEVDAYLARNAARWDQARKQNPPELAERAAKYRDRRLRPA